MSGATRRLNNKQTRRHSRLKQEEQMKKLSLAVALWFAALGLASRAPAAEKATDDKKAPAATKSAADTKPATKDTTDTKAKAGALMVNINKSSKEELKNLKGIGDTRAQDILDYRKKNGDFKSVDELEKVKGIGPGTMKQIRANVTVSGDTVIPKKAEPAKDTKATDTKAPAKDEKKTK
jgi:comEA protein